MALRQIVFSVYKLAWVNELFQECSTECYKTYMTFKTGWVQWHLWFNTDVTEKHNDQFKSTQITGCVNMLSLRRKICKSRLRWPTPKNWSSRLSSFFMQRLILKWIQLFMNLAFVLYSLTYTHTWSVLHTPY